MILPEKILGGQQKLAPRREKRSKIIELEKKNLLITLFGNQTDGKVDS